MADNAAVATAHPLATQIGIEVLRNGGNAVDAAVAVGFCLAVVEPMSSSVSGHGQMLLYMHSLGGKSTALDFSHPAPKAATPNMYRVLRQAESGNSTHEVEEQANVSGYLSVGVPGVAAGLCKAHDLFGTLPLRQLLEPAIHYAEVGFPCDWLTTLRIAEAMPDFVKYVEAAKIFLPKGYPPCSGIDQVLQRDLGQILRRIAKEGADGIYKGEIPRAIEEDMIRHDGLLRSADFADFTVQIGEPFRIQYRGYEVLGIETPGGGSTVLQTLAILENFDFRTLRHNSPEYLHLFIETSRHAFADRYQYLGDNAYVPVPLKGLLSKKYAREVSQQINRNQADLENEPKDQPWVTYANKAMHDPWKYNGEHDRKKTFPLSLPGNSDCTTHFGVIDRNRNMVSCTQTAVGSFGSRVITPGTGLLFSNAMVVFDPRPGTANSIAGYKRALANMAPLLVLRNGHPLMTLGAAGGRKIINCIAQVILNVLDQKMGIQDAITAPRVDAADRETFVDSRLDEKTREALSLMGHNVAVFEESAAVAGFARAFGLMVHPDTGRIHTGVDVFRISEAQGF